MIRDISVGIKPILEFSSALFLDCLNTCFFGAGSQSQETEDTRILRKGQQDLRLMKYSRKVEVLVKDVSGMFGDIRD